ncbi:hypothetical protein Tco_0150460 [Tanacetum coccineum]
MKQDKAQQAARDEKLVPSDDRVKIGKSNLRMDPFVTQKEETYQVVLDIIKNTLCYNAFLISTYVPEIYMQQEILDICLRVQNQSFTVPPSSDSLLEFLLDLGYKGQLKHTSKMYVDQMHQPWRTFGAIINRCLWGKTLSNDRLRPSRIGIFLQDILWHIHYLVPPNKGIDESEREPENKPTGREKRTPRAVVIQEPSSVPVNKTQESSGKLKRAGLRPEVLDELTGKSADSDEEAGTSPEVSDELKDKSEAQYDLEDWGSTDDETFLFEDKEENPEDIPWVSTDDDESDDEEEEDDKSIDIENFDDERMDTDIKDQVKGKAEMKIAEEEEEENTERVKEQKDDEELKADKEQKGDDRAGDEQVVAPVSTTQKETLNLLQSTSSHFVSSNFGNQFINSPNGSVIVSVIPESIHQPPFTPPAPLLPTTEIPSTQVSNSKAVQSVVQRFIELEQAFKELKQTDHSTDIFTLIRSQVPSVVKDYLGSSLPDALKKVLQSHTEELKKELSKKMDYKDVIEESVQANLFNALIWSMLLDEANMKKGDKLDSVPKKRDRGDDQDEDPSAGSNQGKNTKKRRFDESESSKKTSTTKESSKGKSPAKPSKSGKSMIAEERVKEPVFEMALDDVEQTVDDVGQPPHNDVDETQADVASKIPTKDWFKKAPRPEILNPDWNTVKTVDDTLEQP